MTWTQNYDPSASAVLSPLAAAVPVVLLLGLLASGQVPAPVAVPWRRPSLLIALGP